jgi:hypothetical protein
VNLAPLPCVLRRMTVTDGLLAVHVEEAKENQPT